MSRTPDDFTENEFFDEDFLAADHALGTLEADEHRAARRRMNRDPLFRAAVAEWEERLAPLAESLGPVTPPAGLWSRIEAELPLRRAAPVAAPAAGRGRSVPAFWRWLAIGTGGLAAASIAALAFLAVPRQALEGSVPQPVPGFQLAASITSDEGLPIFAVVLDPADGSATLVPIRLETASGQVPELWLVREGGAPESLGVFAADRPLRLAISPETVAGDLTGGVLAISLEPEGGSPTGQPTGPVVGHGDLESI